MARTRGYNGSATGGAGSAFPSSGISAYGATLVDDADAATARATLGVNQIPVPVLTSGRWYRFPNSSSLSATAPSTGSLCVVPKFIPTTTTLDRLGAEVTIAGDAGSKVRLGIYSDDGTGRPGNLVLDAGTINGDSATGQAITINQTLAAGWYWFGMVNQVVTVTNPTWRVLATVTEPMVVDHVGMPTGSATLGLIQSGVTGALPSTFTASPARTSIGVAVFGRVA